MPGVKKVVVPSQRITCGIPDGLHDEMVQVMLSEKKWSDRQEFIRQAIREKVEKWKTR